MPPELQTKLLRALQERTIERVGGQESLRIDVRVLAATNRDLETMMREGRFREDLFYRLNVVTVTLPPLRERRRDIPLLVEHLLAKYAAELGERGVAPEALDRLVGHDWPGNVRELENVVQRAMVMATAGVILPEHLPIGRSEEHTSELQSRLHLVCRLLLEKKKQLGFRTRLPYPTAVHRNHPRRYSPD